MSANTQQYASEASDISRARRKHVLIFRSHLLPLSETFIKEQATHLHDWRASLAGFYLMGSAGLSLEGLDVCLLKTGSLLDRIVWALYRSVGWPVPQRLRSSQMDSPDLVHVHFATDLVAHWAWLRRLKKPIVVTLHGYDVQTNPSWWHSGKGGQQMLHYPEQLRQIATHPLVNFIAVSDATRQSAISKYILPAEKIRTLYIGVDTAAFQPRTPDRASCDRAILFVGRLVEKKGLPVLIRAIASLKDRYPQLELHIIGDGPQRATCEALAEELDCPAVFMGAQRDDIVKQQLTSCYALCLPSIRGQSGDAEGLGMVILEAAAVGIPVLTSATGGRDEAILDGVTGFAFNEGDHVELARRIAYLLDNPDKASAMGQQARDFVCQRFNIVDCTRSLEAYFEHVQAESS